MLTLYYPPFRAADDVELTDQSVIGLRAYVEDLSEFDRDTLRNGWRDVRRAHKVERWPTIQVIRDACLSGASTEAPKAAAGSMWGRRMDSWARTGMWLSSWGPAPTEADTDVPPGLLETYAGKIEAAKEDKRRRHADWARSLGDDDRATVNRVRSRLNAGASVSSMLAAEWESAREIPLMPGEAMSAGSKERMRAGSIARADQREDVA